MNKIIKRILTTLLLATIIVSSLFSQSASFNIIKGNKKSLKVYNEFGKRINIVSNENNLITSKIIFQTSDEPISLSYGLGIVDLAPNSLLVVDPFATKPILYLIDGQLTLDTDTTSILDYIITTPVSKYEFSSPAKVNIISTEKVEYGVFYKGKGTSYNILTGEKTVLESDQMIDMAYPNNFTLEIQTDIGEDINVDNPNIIEKVTTAYIEKDYIQSAERKLASEQERSAFLNNQYLFNVKPIQKSDNFDKYTTINFIITGNGQGNISALNFPAFSGIIKEAKKNNENILLIDGGNTLNGSPYVSFDKGKTVVKALDLIGYDVFVPGPFDFAYGPDYLSQLNKMSEVSFISTNAISKDKLFYLDPYGLYLFDDFKIAVIGLSNPSDLTSLMDLDLTNQILVENAQKAVDAANEVADFVILVSNLNYEGYDSAYILNNVKGLDLVIDSNNSDATLMSINGTPLINTGVGYSQIQNYTIQVKGNEVVSSRYAKLYSSNILEPDNRLLASLNLDSFEEDSQLLDLFNEIEIPSNLSYFLIPPVITNVSVSPTSQETESTVEEIAIVLSPTVVTDEVPPAPTFVTDEVPPTPTFVTDEVPPAPTFVTDEVPPAPTFVSNKTTEGEIINMGTTPPPPTFVRNALVAPKYDKEIKVTVSPEINAPKFKPISFMVKKQQSDIENELLVDQISSESKMKEHDINSAEDAKIKTHIGLDTTVTASADIYDSSFTNNVYLGEATIVPYISYGGYSLGLRLVGYLDDSLSFTSNLYPMGDTTYEIIDYATDLIDHYSIINSSESIYIKGEIEEFEPNTASALVYDSIGGDNLYFNSSFSTKTFQLNTFISDIDVSKPLTGESEDSMGLIAVFKPVDLLNISIGAFAIGDKDAYDIFPTFNLNFLPVYNKDLQVQLNVGTTLYVQTYPTLSFLTLIDPNDPNLVPNYLANASLDITSNTLSLSIGANYLVTQDPSKFTTNMIHLDTTRDDIFTEVDSNTLSAVAKFGYNNEVVDFNLNYTLPMDISSFDISDDLIDVDLAFNFDKINFGGFFLYNDFINNVQSFTDIKSFLINSNTEFGGYLSYSVKDLTLQGYVYVPSSSTSTVPLELELSVNYNLDFMF